MIHSMTGYAVTTKKTINSLLSMELKSLNHRYLDIQFRLPDEFRLLEPVMRELLATKLNRGRIECHLSFAKLSGTENLQQLNVDLMQKLTALDCAVRVSLPDALSLRVVDILRWPGILSDDVLPTDDLYGVCMEALQITADELMVSRNREGQKIKILLFGHLDKINQLISEAGPHIPLLLRAFQEKLAARLRDAMINCDDDRIRQELVLFASKIDVDEELSRLQTHSDEVRRILIAGGVIGKRLDFLMQELNREANTLGSKSADVKISSISMELKILIEQMREQIQNIE